MRWHRKNKISWQFLFWNIQKVIFSLDLFINTNRIIIGISLYYMYRYINHLWVCLFTSLKLKMLNPSFPLFNFQLGHFTLYLYNWSIYVTLIEKENWIFGFFRTKITMGILRCLLYNVCFLKSHESFKGILTWFELKIFKLIF